MKKALVAVALLLIVLPAIANAYIVQGSTGGPAEVTFGTGHYGGTPWNTTTNIVVLDSYGNYYSSYFTMQDPGEWDVKRLYSGGPIGWVNVKLWVSDLGPEGHSQQQWAVYMNNQMGGWGHEWQKVYQGAFFSTTGTAANPNFVYSSDFSSSTLNFKLVAVTEPGSLAALLGGCIGLSATITRRRKL